MTAELELVVTESLLSQLEATCNDETDDSASSLDDEPTDKISSLDISDPLVSSTSSHGNKSKGKTPMTINIHSKTLPSTEPLGEDVTSVVPSNQPSNEISSPMKASTEGESKSLSGKHETKSSPSPIPSSNRR